MRYAVARQERQDPDDACAVVAPLHGEGLRAKRLGHHAIDVRLSVLGATARPTPGLPRTAARVIITADLVRELSADFLDAMADAGDASNVDLACALNLTAERVRRMRSAEGAAFQIGHVILLVRRLPQVRVAVARALLAMMPELVEELREESR